MFLWEECTRSAIVDSVSRNATSLDPAGARRIKTDKCSCLAQGFEVRELVLILNRKDIENLVNMKEAMEVVEKAFLEFHEKKGASPKRLVIGVNEYKGFVYYMPAYLSGMGSLTIKIVTQYEENLGKHGLPTVLASILMNDPETGRALALMEGTYITALRTGAASGVASKYLARKDSEIVGVIGTGAQARTQISALCEVLKDIEEVKAYDLYSERAERFAEDISLQFGLDVKAVKTSKECVENSEVLVLATASRVPALDGDWVKAGTHINSIGVMGPEGRELDDKTIKKAKIVVDTKEGALAETGDLKIPISRGTISEDDIYAELHEIVAGRKPGRTSDSEITCWKAVGLAIEDAAVAKLVYDKARKERLGKEVKI